MNKMFNAVSLPQSHMSPANKRSTIGKLFNSIFIYRVTAKDDSRVPDLVVDKALINKLGRLWDGAHKNMKSGRYSIAAKSLRSILEIDPMNAAAYNRLGILEAKRKNYNESIKDFQFAVSIEPTASGFHNLGLIFYETKQYKKSSSAFAKSIKLEPNLAARHVAFAKVNEALGRDDIMHSSLIRAAQLEPNKETFKLLQGYYVSRGMTEEADQIALDIKNLKKIYTDDDIDENYEDMPLEGLLVKA
jgi:tetratricopeptide (TPR) repeat protein